VEPEFREKRIEGNFKNPEEVGNMNASFSCALGVLLGGVKTEYFVKGDSGRIGLQRLEDRKRKRALSGRRGIIGGSSLRALCVPSFLTWPVG